MIAVLPRDVCPLAEVADVARYMEGQGAGQCGPCIDGLAELADDLERLAYGHGRAPSAAQILETCESGRGTRARAATPTGSRASSGQH